MAKLKDFIRDVIRSKMINNRHYDKALEIKYPIFTRVYKKKRKKKKN